jgi:IclR family transcriptional regulator, KDG regulon repressor
MEQYSTIRNPARRSGAANGNQAVVRALDLLELVCNADHPVSLAEASARQGLSKPTAHRLLRTLVERGLIAQDPQMKGYRPGLKLFELSSAVLRGMTLRAEALPELRELCQRTNETVHLAVLDDGEVIYIDKEETQQTIRMFSAIGKRGPAHCTGVGKVLLAHLPTEELRAMLAGKPLQRFTDTTIVTTAALQEELALVRQRGYAIDDTEHEADIRCAACPVRDHTGRVIAAISLTVPAIRMSRARIESMAPLVRTYADRISRRLGYVPDTRAAPAT